MCDSYHYPTKTVPSSRHAEWWLRRGGDGECGCAGCNFRSWQNAFLWLDFGQSRTLPLGPVEGGNWFYAPARQQVNLLGYYVWGCGMDKPTYVTFLSNILEHDSSYVEAAYEALFKLLPSASSVLCHEQWGDVGLHFRSYQHFAYFLDTLPQRWKTAGSLQFLEVEHGKGKIDGMMGRIRQWTNVIASKSRYLHRGSIREAPPGPSRPRYDSRS